MSIVLFSGGCDSTLVLYNLLMNDYKTGNNFTTITALSINHCQIIANEQNKKARENFRGEIRKRGLDHLVSFCDVDINSTCGSIHSIGEYGLSQPIIWSAIAMLYMHFDDTIYLGYHRGDDFWEYRTEFENIILNVCKICDKKINIEYPLRGMEKSEIIQTLKDRGLYDICWYCEYPTSDNNPCGKCVPCRTHRTALWQNEAFGAILPTQRDFIDYPCKEKKYDN